MKCTKCGKTFASHTNGPEICWECHMKDIDNYMSANSSSNCDMPLPQGFGEQKGWICPVCGRGVAPWVDFCPCQGEMKITYATSTVTDDEELNRLFELNDKRVAEMIEFENADLLEG